MDNDFYNSGNWDASDNYPNGNATFAGSTNTSISRTSNTYNYLYGLYFTNTLSTDAAFTIGADNTETQINWGGNIISTTALTDGGSLTDVINVNLALTGGNTTQWAKEFRINTGHNLTINGNLTSGNTTDYSFTKKGDGTLTLGGVNTFAAPVTVSEGTLVLTSKDGLGNGGASIGAGAETTVNSGATLKLNYSNANVASQENLIINGSGVAGTGAIHSVDSDHAGKITLGSDATINVETRMDHHGTAVIDGTGTLTKTGTGSLVRAGAMTVDNFVVEAGEYLMTGDSVLITGDGTNAKATTIKNGGKVSMWKGFSVTNTPDIIMEAGASFAVTSNTADQTTSMNGKFTLNGDAKFENWSHDHTVLADITGTGTFTSIALAGQAYNNNALVKTGSTWSVVLAGVSYTFSETTGDLAVVVPEPGTYALFVGIFSLTYLIYRRRG